MLTSEQAKAEILRMVKLWPKSEGHVAEYDPVEKAQRLLMFGRVIVGRLTGLKISPEQLEAITDAVRTEAAYTNHARAIPEILDRAGKAHRQAFQVVHKAPEDSPVRLEQVKAADVGCEMYGSQCVPHHAGESMMEYAVRILGEHHHRLSEYEAGSFRRFVSSRADWKPKAEVK